MKVLLTPVRFYPFIGGVEYYAYYLGKELVKLGHDVKVLCANEPRLDENDKIGNIQVKRLNYVGKIANTNITQKLPFELLREEYDIMHSCMPTPWSSDCSAVISKARTKPFVLTIQNDIDKPHNSKYKLLSDIYLNTFYRLLLKLADKIILVNPHYKEVFKNTSHFIEKYDEKIEIIPNGVDTKKFRRTGNEKDENTILFVSVLDIHHKFKGLDYLIDAMRLILKEAPDAKLIVAGEGKLKKHYEEVAKKKGLGKHIIFFGLASHEELSRLYNKANVFVLPSVDVEGFGMVLLESMACETPVVATEIVGMQKEILEYNSGKIVKARDSEALAHAIIEITQDKPLARKMGRNGRKLVEKRFTWERVAAMTEKVYLSVHNNLRACS